jgi:hypothetical protein
MKSEIGLDADRLQCTPLYPGRVLYNQLSWTIGAADMPGYVMPIGQANQVGKTAEGLALWRLRVRNAEVPGSFIIVDGAFVEVEAVPGSD